MDKEKRKLYKNVFTELDKINPDGDILSESALSTVSSWTSTGSYALNAICSGSLYKGIPNGRIVGLSGPSGCGKTLMATKMLANHMAQGEDYWGIVFDSEIAYDADTARRLGCDTSRIKYYPINTVLEARNQIKIVTKSIIDAGLQGKFFIILDSLGNLAGDKEVSDTAKNSFAADMGLRAKDIKSLFRSCTMPAAKSKTTIVFNNHVYADPASMYESAVKNQSGGEGPTYMSSLLIQLGYKREKNEKQFAEEEILAAAKKVGGITMHALTVKNRFIPQMLMTDIYLNFISGLDEYSGLFELASDLNVITCEGYTWFCNGEKLGNRKNWEKDPAAWAKIMPGLELEINKKFTFHSEAEKMAQEVENLKKEIIIESTIDGIGLPQCLDESIKGIKC